MGFVVTRPDLDSNVMTPVELAKRLVEHFNPSGKILEPCRGDGGFYNVLPPGTLWCEIREDRNFFDFNERVDWIITNPPWSMVTQFLKHSLDIADNICFIIVLQQIWTKKRLRLIRDSGFAIKEICCFDAPANFPRLGIQIGMIHIQKGWQGDIRLSQL
jgi:hypothetical protein